MLGFLAGIPGKLKTVIDYLNTNMSTARTAKIDNLDAAISTRAPSSTALSTATWDATKAGYLDMAVSGVARIKSIQHINSTQSAGNDPAGVYATITINSVSVSKTIVIFNGVSGSNSTTWSAGGGRLHLSSSTQLTFAASRDSSDAFNFTINAVVVEFY